MLTHERIKEKLTEKFGEILTNWEEPYAMLTFTAPKEDNLKVLQYLKEDTELNFVFLTAICAVHYPDNVGAELAVVYHLHNLVDNVRLRLKVFTNIETPDVFTAVNIYAGANWMERETYDFFGHKNNFCCLIPDVWYKTINNPFTKLDIQHRTSNI